MEKWSFLQLAENILQEEGKPLSEYEIWEIAKSKGYDKNVSSQGKTPWRTMCAQMYVNMRDKKDSPFMKVGSRPRRFFLKKLFKGTEAKVFIEKDVIPQKKFDYLEHELHPFLAYYAYFYLRAYTKTILHLKSKKEFGEWVHPDMVGFYFPVGEWGDEVVALNAEIGNISIKLFSFEIKRELNFSNLRESFFQSVSNSSWANEGYLVASQIAQDEDFQNELRRLSNSFGIGVIQLNIDDPDSSEVVFPARSKENLDWETINKLTINADFKEFLKRVKNDISSKEIRKEKYDKIFTKEELLKQIKKK
ncbi:MAG TPA: HTH domain-containing protein [Syntrophorhabdaceae bacterium]|nr:HTH domain-containing protein [Syntrophorhabdaceae bacterium]